MRGPSPQLVFFRFALFVVGGGGEAVRKRRDLSCGGARVPVSCNRMRLVVEPIKEAVMKMLAVFMDKAGLTQHEINHM